MVSNWTASLNKCVFKCWDRMAPGVCLPEKAPSLSPPHRQSLFSSLISPIKDIHCSPAVMALQQQIRHTRTHTYIHVHTHTLCYWSYEPLNVVRQRQTELEVDKGRCRRYKLHTCAFFAPHMQQDTHPCKLHGRCTSKCKATQSRGKAPLRT